MPAGELREKVGFYLRAAQSDGYGNEEAEFSLTPEFTTAARIMPKLGGEQVMAARLSGKNFVNITVRYSSLTVEVTTDWQVVNERSGEIYNIRSIINPDERRRYLEMLCESFGERQVVIGPPSDATTFDSTLITFDDTSHTWDEAA